MDNGASSYLRFLSGDKDGLADIIRNYRDGLVLYINSIVGNIIAAEEIMEDTFVKLYVDKPKFKGKSSFKTWLYSIARFTAIDYIRKHPSDLYTQLEAASGVADNADLEKRAIKNEEKRALHKALQKLKPEYEQALYLTYFEDFSNRETADIMKKTEKQIRDLLYHARKALKTELDKEGFVYEKL
ncbi:RNA polymerase sigma factor [Ruminococcus sp. XPD3002]|uniref:RNA polymerase sigma factor n=1 Tax=Ruminococcus sp. XPD3002 TaxID=1452269 RepID=UPI00091C41D2|nr:RNA polymerase sigma factor [Ruminococcus sp.]SFX24858.1 RNA polymerase sigma-70 factor, ECF subfamily [Ruminococcus flavefaciens]HRU96436.1 RNA polymerase sigma factor [Ruminococcus sp.]